MISMRVIAFVRSDIVGTRSRQSRKCPHCHRRTSAIIDVKTAVRAFCKDCNQPMQPFSNKKPNGRTAKSFPEGASRSLNFPLCDQSSRNIIRLSKPPLRKWSPVSACGTLNKIAQGDFWRHDEIGTTLKIASILRGRDDPGRVGTIFAGRPFLLVRFLLDEQKKMNNPFATTKETYT